MEIRERLIKTKLIQGALQKRKTNLRNAQMKTSHLKEHCNLTDTGITLLRNAMKKLGLSARAYDRILKVARTIADLEASENIETNHLAEAIQYRSLDREGWAG